jgi:membrane associated rhomboid family serine protease
MALDHHDGVALLFLLVIIAVLGLRMTSGDDRKQLLGKGVALLRELAVVAREEYQRQEPFRAVLRSRMRYAIVMPLFAAVIILFFAAMLFGAGSLSHPATLIGWGSNFGPKTTNGEWWRLLTATFVHAGFVRMVIEAAAVVQIGMLLERLTGRATVAIVFCAAGIVAALVNVALSPMAVTAGTSGAVFGLYGLLLAVMVRSLRAKPVAPSPEEQTAESVPESGTAGVEPIPGIVVPSSALLWLVPVSVLFLLSVWSNSAFAFKAEMAGFGVGLVAGAVLTGGIAYALPEPRRVLITAAVTAVVLVACAVPLRGIADVRPEISRIIALEDTKTGEYRTALERFNKGRMTADALAQVIDRSIVPELESADAKLLAIRGVPPEHQPLVAAADEFLRMRTSSWRLQADTWRNRVKPRRREADGTLMSDASWREAKAQFRADAATRGKAEGADRASLELLQRLKESNNSAADRPL